MDLRGTDLRNRKAGLCSGRQVYPPCGIEQPHMNELLCGPELHLACDKRANMSEVEIGPRIFEFLG